MTDIGEMYNKYGISLKNTGRLWKSPCPFHSEKDPSFTVYPDGSYYCFGCHKHGTYKDFCEIFGNGDIEEIATQSIDSIVEKSIVDFEKIKRQYENDLYNSISELDYINKSAIWFMFDEFILDVSFMCRDTDIDIIDIIIFLKKEFSKITQCVTELLN